jgi:Rhodopirellula transposase DDE domain
LIGNLYREGKLYTQGIIEVLDHDFPSLADGVAIPHGIYDMKSNEGYVNIGTSHDTSEFACDCLRQWWKSVGQQKYSQASSILLLCDGGGSNGARTYIFKSDLEKFAAEIGLEIRVAHYPPYLSKYNPIEHLLFPHLTRACKGVIFTSIALVKQLMEKASTKTGLSVTVNILDKVYLTGRKVAADFKQNMRVIFDDTLPKLNYIVLPSGNLTAEVI